MKKKQQKQQQQQTRLKRMPVRVIITLTLLLWLISCTSTQTNNTAPRVTPPDPYNDAGELVLKYIDKGETITAQEDGVFFPYWYFEKIFDYIVDTQAAQEMSGEK